MSRNAWVGRDPALAWNGQDSNASISRSPHLCCWCAPGAGAVTGWSPGRPRPSRWPLNTTATTRLFGIRLPVPGLALWGLIVLAALGGHLWLWRLPFPDRLSGSAVVHAQPGQLLRIENPASTTRLLRFDGRPGEAVDIRFERASLALFTLALLRSVGLDPPSGEVALEGWPMARAPARPSSASTSKRPRASTPASNSSSSKRA